MVSVWERQAALEDLVSVLCDAAQPKRARMFAAAALQNLAGDMYDANDVRLHHMHSALD
jgi:hypothetical protein